jgi:hypothetical protein
MHHHRKSPHPAVAACLVLLLLVPAACTAPVTWRELPTRASFGDVWQALTETARLRRFYEDPLETDRGLRVYVSKWNTTTGVFANQARRTRLHARIDRDPTDEGIWLVEFHVEAQRIDKVGRGLRQTERDWSDAGQAGDEEDQIRGMLNARLGQELDVVPTHQRR